MREYQNHLIQQAESESGNMDLLRSKIIKLVQEEVKTNKNFKRLTYNDLELLVFARPNSMRLTYTGYLLLSKSMKSYKFTHEVASTANTYIGLAKIRYPYYLNATTFVSFSEEEALLLSLHGGDLDLFLKKMGETYE